MTHDLVHRIRTEGLSDAHWERSLGISRSAVQKARVGTTWPKHPTPPDTAPRAESHGGGRPHEDRLPQMSQADQHLSRLLSGWRTVSVEHSLSAEQENIS